MSIVQTVTVQIGNSDDRLTQKEWSSYIKETHRTIQKHAQQLHFTGGSSQSAPWQNYCWVFNVSGSRRECKQLLVELVKELGRVRHMFDQESIAFSVGTTEFI